jgi:hypothetical protein
MTKQCKKYNLHQTSCTQQNRNEEKLSQKETVNQKEETQELTTKYIPPHLRNDGKT